MPTQHHMGHPSLFYGSDPRTQGFLTPQNIGNGMSAHDYFHYQVVDRPQSAGPHMGTPQQVVYNQAVPTPTTSPRPVLQRHASHPFVLRLAPQHYVPSTPSLSTSRSSLSVQSVESPALAPHDVDYFGQKHCEHPYTVVVNEDMPLLGSTHSPPMSPGESKWHYHERSETDRF